jgi:hypothetical protein
MTLSIETTTKRKPAPDAAPSPSRERFIDLMASLRQLKYLDEASA